MSRSVSVANGGSTYLNGRFDLKAGVTFHASSDFIPQNRFSSLTLEPNLEYFLCTSSLFFLYFKKFVKGCEIWLGLGWYIFFALGSHRLNVDVLYHMLSRPPKHHKPTKQNTK